ncbi:hypothetical protein BaRGS_00011455, partial [Batillaria attramentaria]
MPLINYMPSLSVRRSHCPEGVPVRASKPSRTGWWAMESLGERVVVGKFQQAPRVRCVVLDSAGHDLELWRVKLHTLF